MIDGYAVIFDSSTYSIFQPFPSMTRLSCVKLVCRHPFRDTSEYFGYTYVYYGAYIFGIALI